ncbi:hypothetical protein [Pseudoneobacillus sp. C159]
MATFNTVEKAKAEIIRIQMYIDLVESYVPNTLDKFIIKEYAICNSIDKALRAVNDAGYSIKDSKVDRDYVVTLLKSKSADELHRLVRARYLKKTKHRRNF